MGLEPLLDAISRARRRSRIGTSSGPVTEMPNFAGVPIEEHRRDSTGAVILLVACAAPTSTRCRRRPGSLLLDLGERRAAQGVPLEDMLRSWRMGIEEAMGYATEIAPQIGLDEGEVFGFFQQAFEVVDEAMVEIARGHRTDPAPEDPEEGRRATFVRDLLEGGLSPEEVEVRLRRLRPRPARISTASDSGRRDGLELGRRRAGPARLLPRPTEGGSAWRCPSTASSSG